MVPVVVIRVEGPTAMERVTQAEDPVVMDLKVAMEVIRVGEATGMVTGILPMGLGMKVKVIPVGMGLEEDRTKCLGNQLFSGRVLKLLAKFCEDFKR